jgi:hypothetical protein
MTTAVPAIRSRKPTGVVPWPTILIEGPEKSGKTYTAYLFSASKRVGQTYVMDLGEGSADEYGAIPGARYRVLQPAGEQWTWADIVEQVTAVKAEAARASAAGEPPVVLEIDTMTDEWEGIRDWLARLTVERARKRNARPPTDASGETKIPNDLWNIGNARHRQLMTMLLTFPGIVVLTARGKVTAKIGPDGKPVEGQRDYKVEAQKTLGYDVSLWLRMSREAPPTVIGCRSVTHGVQPGVDPPMVIEGEHRSDLLDWLVFDVLKCDPVTAHVRDIRTSAGGQLTAAEAAEIGMPADDDQPAASDAQALAELQQDIAAADSDTALLSCWTASVELVRAGHITRADGGRAQARITEKRRQLGRQDAAA